MAPRRSISRSHSYRPGLKYKGARVNGSIVPVSYKVENGDIIEILTHPTPRPPAVAGATGNRVGTSEAEKLFLLA